MRLSLLDNEDPTDADEDRVKLSRMLSRSLKDNFEWGGQVVTISLSFTTMDDETNFAEQISKRKEKGFEGAMIS